jgi:integrase
VALYKASPAYEAVAASTKTHRGPWLDRIAKHFGGLSIAAFDNPKVRKIILQWRAKYAATPRAADMGMQVLSRVCSHGVESGALAVNPCEGIKALYSADRSAIIWTEADIARIKAAGSPEVGYAVDLGATTGLRRGALLRLSWSHIGDLAIEMPPLPGHKKTGIVPLYGELRAVLAGIPKRATTVLTNSNGTPWTGDGFGSMITKAKKKAGIGSELHFHDLRGTAATTFYVAGLSTRVIAEILGWSETSVEGIIRRYVGRSAAMQAVIKQLDEARGRGIGATEERE